MWFGRINTSATDTLATFDAVKQDLESELAKLTPHYEARDIDLSVPDFVDIAIVAGDARYARRGVLGQALPNWTYEEVGFRQNIMLGIGTDSLSQDFEREKASRWLAPATLEHLRIDSSFSAAIVAGHELTHSIGAGRNAQTVDPVTGEPRLDESGEPLRAQQAIGDSYATGLEELRAETGSLYWTGWFVEQGSVSVEDAKAHYVHHLMWALNKVGQGMTEPNGTARTYSRVAGVQIRFLMQQNALEYTEEGKFLIHFGRYHEAITELLEIVSAAQITGDRETVAGLFDPIVEGQEGYAEIHAEEIMSSLADIPQPSMTYIPTGID